MEFSQRKLPREAGEKLRVVPVSDIRVNEILFSPAYVFLKLNEKFVSVKGPLDFFTGEDLAKVRSVGRIFLSPVIDHVISFQQLGRRGRTILLQTGKGDLELSPASFILSHQMAKILGSLWNLNGRTTEEGALLEPFFVIAFVASLCDPIALDLWKRSRDQSMENFERALTLSSWAVFLALHLGWTQLEHLSRLRSKIFEAVTDANQDQILNRIVPSSLIPFGLEAEIYKLAVSSLDLSGEEWIKPYNSKQFDALVGRNFLKIRDRLAHMEQYLDRVHPRSSLFGEGGFLVAA